MYGYVQHNLRYLQSHNLDHGGSTNRNLDLGVVPNPGVRVFTLLVCRSKWVANYYSQLDVIEWNSLALFGQGIHIGHPVIDADKDVSKYPCDELRRLRLR